MATRRKVLQAMGTTLLTSVAASAQADGDDYDDATRRTWRHCSSPMGFFRPHLGKVDLAITRCVEVCACRWKPRSSGNCRMVRSLTGGGASPTSSTTLQCRKCDWPSLAQQSKAPGYRPDMVCR